MHIVNSKRTHARTTHPRAASHGYESDSHLLMRARGKDVAAFEELVRRTEDTLYQLAMRYVRNESDAQEILQNAYLSAWRSLPTFEGRAQFGCWMYRITVNASLMLLRTRNRHPEVAIHDVERDELDEAIRQTELNPQVLKDWTKRPDEECQSAELRKCIELAVAALPEILQSTFVLRNVKQMSIVATAGELGVSIPAIKTRLHRAHKALREALGSHVSS